MAITKVWLDESDQDCTMCGLCASKCPEVFVVPEKMKIVNNPDLTRREQILDAASHCPVSVIALEIDNSGKRDNIE